MQAAKDGAQLFKKPRRDPSQVFDLNFRTLNEILRPMLDQDDPAKRGKPEKGEPEEQTKKAHLLIVRIGASGRKVSQEPCESGNILARLTA